MTAATGVRYGITLGAAGPGRDPRSLARLAKLAEDNGWDGLFLEDYLDYQGEHDLPTYDPWICLAAMAMTTTRIRLGTSVTPVPRRRPWKLAAEAVSIDQLSNGRLILMVGLGDLQDPFFDAVDEPTDDKLRAELLDEALTIIDRLWTGEPVWYDGKHYRLHGVRLAARPVQRPRIPIYVGGDIRRAGVRRRAARWDGCWEQGPLPPEIRQELLDLVARTREPGSGSQPPYVIGSIDWTGTWVEPGAPERTEEVIRAGPSALGRTR